MKRALVLTVAVLAAGCASRSESILANYTSPNMYNGYTFHNNQNIRPGLRKDAGGSGRSGNA